MGFLLRRYLLWHAEDGAALRGDSAKRILAEELAGEILSSSKVVVTVAVESVVTSWR